MQRLVVTITCSRQIAEDRWEVYHPTMVIDEQTTMKDVVLWANSQDANWKEMHITHGQFPPL